VSKGELLMTTDEKVELARQLADQLRIKRGEWQRWATYFRRTGDLGKALQLAEHQGSSPAVRHDPQTAAQKIAEVIGQHRAYLEQLSPGDLQEVFSYVGRWLEYLSRKVQQQRRGRK